MKFYFAPMEGVTGYVYRNAYHACFGHIDKYFAPFIVASQSYKIKSKHLNDILPENNKGFQLIPQILTNNAKDFIHTSMKIKELGYQEINLNLGCPSGTVVSKNRGAGFLAKQRELDQFFEEVFSNQLTDITVKTRIGVEDPEEFYELIRIFNKYPIKELIIHPRTQKDFYKNTPNLNVFKDALTLSKNPVCYNGDIVTAKDYNGLLAAFPTIDTVMIGRGLLTNPGLITEIVDRERLDKNKLKDFHDRIFESYSNILFGERNVLFKMKELWFYMIMLFSDHSKYAKKIKKAEKFYDYESAVSALFKEQDLIEIQDTLYKKDR